MNGGHSAQILDQSRPTIFIGSSTEGLIIAEAVQANLSRLAQAQLWNGGFSEPTKSFLETLCKKVGEFDFAVLILTADDWVTIRGSEELAPRDNLLFELGIFIGSIGRERTFFMCNQNDCPRIPSDLQGVTYLTFITPNKPKDLAEWVTTVGPACNQVASLIQDKGPLYRPFEDPMLLTLENLRSAARVQHQAFRDEIAIECIQWRKQSDSWAKRFLKSSQGYKRLLLNVYKLAKRTMFSTSIPQYRSTWMSTLGDNILQIQKSNGDAKATRVFIFNRRLDVTDADRAIFQKHINHGVEVFLFFDETDDGFDFPADIGNDWTIIDEGEVIGITRHFPGIDNETSYEASWHFEDKDEAIRIRRLQEDLMNRSERFR